MNHRPLHPCFNMRGRGSPAGFALVPALFLIVVLAVLGAVAIRVGNGEQQTVTMALQQARALAAARTGIEWGAYNALVSAGHSCAPSTTLTLTEAALNGFTVVVTCSATSFTSDSLTRNAYVLVANSSSGTYGQPGYVHRVVSATFTDASG
jgi:MSHA biogenesis protein MshP